jgi:uncharacterized OB-fold protein
VQILPAATPLSQPYWDAARDEKVVFQQCRQCATRWHPPMPMCPNCHATDYAWETAAGTGSIYTYTVVRHSTHPAFQELPYVVAVVELDEGPRIVTNVKRCAAEDVHGGMRVGIFFETAADGVKLAQAAPL